MREKREAALCRIASGKSIVSKFSLREFDIWYLMLLRDSHWWHNG